MAKELSTAPKILVTLLLVACLLVLTKYILFKKSPHYYQNYFRREYARYRVKEGKKNANFELFKTIKLMQSDRLRTEYKADNLIGNIAGFIPLGLLIPMLFRGLRRSWKTVPIVFLISLGFETAQLLTGLGVFDIDDLVLNTLGGAIGYLLFRILFSGLRNLSNRRPSPATA